MAIWDIENETMSRDRIRAIQGERLQKVAGRVYETVPFYRRMFDEARLKPGDIKSVDDLTKIPFTTKDDFREQ